MFLCCVSSPLVVYQTPNCNFLSNVTQSFSSHSYFLFVDIFHPSVSFSFTGCRAGLLSTHKIRLLTFGFWHLSSTAFQKGDLWETLSPTQHSAKLGWFFSSAVHNSGRLDTERYNLWWSPVYFFHHRNWKRFTSPVVFSLFQAVPPLTLSVFLLFIPACAVSCDL